MAQCEKCGKGGWRPMAMFVESESFIGPCCAQQSATPIQFDHIRMLPQPQSTEPEYGIEISNKVGVKAYVSYSGLQLSFERSPEEIRRWAMEAGVIEAKKIGA